MRPHRLVSSRGLRAAALAVAPVVLVLALPASAAAAVEVTPAPDGCGIVVALTGLGVGTHTAVVRTTLPGGDAVPVAPVEDPAPAATTPAAEPPLTAERTLTGDGEVVVVLDAAAVPDADPRVLVAVTVDGEASPAVELALPGCAAPVTPTPTTTPTPAPTAPPTTAPTAPPTTAPTAGPTTAPTTPATDAPTPTPAPPAVEPAPTATAEPLPAVPTATAAPTAAPALPSAPASPSAGPSAPASPSASPTPTTAPRPTAGTSTAPARPAAASPLLSDAPVPSPGPELDDTLEQAYGAYDLGTGTSGYLSLMSFTAVPQLDAAPGDDAVPAPVIAAPEGSAAGVLAAPEDARGRLEDLLPSAPERGGNDTPPAQLAAPDLATDTAADPLVDLAPAAFVLSASLGGLLMAGRRRTG